MRTGRPMKLAKADFAQFIQTIINQHARADKTIGSRAKDCMFRINRDVRFAAG